MGRIPLNGLQTFLTIVEQGSLSAAAKALGVRPPAVSQQLSAFENDLGVSLFVRNTRSVFLTNEGEALWANSSNAMATLRGAIDEARGAGLSPKGKLRVSLPYRAYRLVILPKLKAFQRDYPEVQLDFSINETLIDIVAEKFHAGIRLGDNVHEDMIAVRLTPPLRGATVASPRYFDQHSRPQQPSDLLEHNCIQYRQTGTPGHSAWQYRDRNGASTLEVKGTLILDDFRSVVDAARNELGIGWTMRIGAEEELQDGQLESVLDEFAIERPGFFLYFPRTSSSLKILRVFTDFFRLAPGKRSRPDNGKA